MVLGGLSILGRVLFLVEANLPDYRRRPRCRRLERRWWLECGVGPGVQVFNTQGTLGQEWGGRHMRAIINVFSPAGPTPPSTPPPP